MTTLAVQADLAVIAQRVRECWEQSKTHQIDAWEGYLTVGGLLIEARNQFPSDPLYGHWFEEQGFGFTPQWGGRLRRLAEDRPAVVALLDSALSGSGKLPGVDTLLGLLNPPTAQPEGNGLEVDRPAPVYEPDHLRTAVVEIIVTYPFGTTKREEGSGHGSGAERKEWHAEIPMATDIPDSAAALEPFANELWRRFIQAVHERPFKTMLR